MTGTEDSETGILTNIFRIPLYNRIWPSLQEGRESLNWKRQSYKKNDQKIQTSNVRGSTKHNTYKKVAVKAANLLFNSVISAWALLHLFYTDTAFTFPLPKKNSWSEMEHPRPGSQESTQGSSLVQWASGCANQIEKGHFLAGHHQPARPLCWHHQHKPLLKNPAAPTDPLGMRALPGIIRMHLTQT